MSNDAAKSRSGTNSDQPIIIKSMTPDEEDSLITVRIQNDEKALRRVARKFHTYSCLAHTPLVPSPTHEKLGSAEDAREAFLIELASFQLTLKKSAMICEAEIRQVQEYEQEKARIEHAHGNLRGQIEQLKTSLEHAQMMRKRKMEYDVIANKVNTLQSREELEAAISSLEDDMSAIRTEQETQQRAILAQKQKFDLIISDLNSLRMMSKEDTNDGTPSSRPGTPVLDSLVVPTEVTEPDHGQSMPSLESGEVDEIVTDISPSHRMNPAAAAFVPSPLRNMNSLHDSDDVEMGELSEDQIPGKVKKKVREELEEGEASDTSNALTDIGDN